MKVLMEAILSLTVPQAPILFEFIIYIAEKLRAMQELMMMKSHLAVAIVTRMPTVLLNTVHA